MKAFLLVASVIVYLIFLASRYSRRLRLPVVTSFLLLGIVVGPEALNVLDTGMLEPLSIVEPLALGVITFAAGERLHLGDVRTLRQRDLLAVLLETLLPAALVGAGAWIVSRRLEVALPIATIAATSGVATVMHTLKESGAKGGFARLLGFAVATDNFFAILMFSLMLPVAVAMETGQVVGGLFAEGLLNMAGSIGLGMGAGFLVSRLLRHIRSPGELSLFVLAHIVLVIGITNYLGLSVLLAGLAMGGTAVNLARDERERDRAFGALGTLEFPLIALFFVWAGASLHFDALLSAGLLFAVYVCTRALGKLGGPLLVRWGLNKHTAEARTFLGLGMSLLPQAGAAVGLGILARDTLPIAGDTILATVLASVVVFELVGPLGVHWAARHVGEAQKDEADGEEPLTLGEAVKELEDTRSSVAVLVDSQDSAASLEVARRLAERLGSGLLVVPLGGRETASRWMRHAEPEGGTSTDHGAAEGTVELSHVSPQETGLGLSEEGLLGRETVLEPVPLDQEGVSVLLAALQERSPDAILLSSSSSDRARRLSQQLGLRLSCPLIEISDP